jgi:xanthine dehydrogenase iron-sulfur cluster and FAD-binding subunit A
VRTVAIADFFTGYRQTLLRDDEVMTRIFLPRPSATSRFRTFKVSKRRELDIAIRYANGLKIRTLGFRIGDRSNARGAHPASLPFPPIA